MPETKLLQIMLHLTWIVFSLHLYLITRELTVVNLTGEQDFIQRNETGFNGNEAMHKQAAIGKLENMQ